MMKPLVHYALLAAIVALPMHAVEIIAHRGASYDAPENTLPAVRLGFEQQADAVEIDVYLSKDGKIVVIHDATTKRIGGVDKKVEDQTLDELRQLDMGAWKGAKWAGTRIPTLEEVLAETPPGKKLFIEIKCGEEILPELERVLDASGKRSQAVIIAFSYAVTQGAKKRMPDVPAYWLYGFSAREKAQYKHPSLDRLIKMAREAGAEGLNVHYRGAFDKAWVDRVRAAGMEVYVWTVNEPADARRLREMGVAGITTDRPAFIREQLGL